MGSREKRTSHKRIAAVLILVISIFPQITCAQNTSESELKEAESLRKKAIEIFNKTGKYEEAIPHAKKALEIIEKISGREHINAALTLDTIAWLYFSGKNYKEAEPVYKKALEIREKALGSEHTDIALSLNYLGRLYRETGRYAEGEAVYRRARVILEKNLGREHQRVATIINNLALLYDYSGRYLDAEPLFKQALAIYEKIYGKEHKNVVTTTNNLADLYRKRARYSEAEPLYTKALEIMEKTLDKWHLDLVENINNLAGLYNDAGRYTEAEPFYKRALEIREKGLAKEHPKIAASLNDLAMLHYKRGWYSTAEPLYLRALAISGKKSDSSESRVYDLNIASTLNNLGLLYDATGRYSEAEYAYKKALSIREKELGREHTQVAATLSNMAQLYYKTGRHSEAESLYLRAMEIYKRALDRGHTNPARLLASTMTTLNNLALLYSKINRYSEVEPLHKALLDISEKALGKEHPLVAATINNTAEIYRITGRYSEAEPLYKTALGIMEKTLGKQHPDVASTLLGTARLYAALKKYNEGHQLFARGIAINETVKEDSFLLLSERQKLSYMKQQESDVYTFITHTVRYLQSDTSAVIDTFNTWIKWKGSVMETQTRYLDAVLYSDVLSYSRGSDIRNNFDKLTNVRREIARLRFSKPENLTVEEYKRKLEELEKKKDFLETELNKASATFTLERIAGKADVKAISDILPPNSIYLDFAKIQMYDFKKDNWDKFRYLLFVLVPQKSPVVKLIDIADTEEVDRHINAYLNEMNKAKTAQRLPDIKILIREAKALYRLIMKPVEPFMKGKKVIFISPDGNLNLIPFEILITLREKYLMEDYLINYVAAGRDILRFTDTTSAEGESVVIADHDYDMGQKEMEGVIKQIGFAGIRVGGRISKDAIEMSFGRLPDTKEEADSIEKILKNKLKLSVKTYQGKQALEETLLKTEHPKVLHLATHGYFLKEEEIKDSELRGITLKLKEGAEKENLLNIENPMLRSGIVLASANTSLKEGRDEGMVSAEKILGLKLKGTDLVVLSACETGIGDVQAGEGVFGLKRAFILSGAKTLVMSLWSVPSKETTELMTDFYTLMAEGKTKAESLRQAKLKMMKKKQNPFYWGAFVMTGRPE